MDLVERFSPRAEAEGLFTTEINFSEVVGNTDFGAQRGKENFLFHAKRACYELGIVVGYNETPTGFALGFECKEDHDRFMDVVGPRMARDAEREKRGINKLVAIYGPQAQLDREREEAAQRAARVEELRAGATPLHQSLSPDEAAIFERYKVKGFDDEAQSRNTESSQGDGWHHDR